MALSIVHSAPSHQAAPSHLNCRRDRPGPPLHQDEEGRGGVLRVQAETRVKFQLRCYGVLLVLFGIVITKYWSSDGCTYTTYKNQIIKMLL